MGALLAQFRGTPAPHEEGNADDGDGPDHK